MPIWQDAVQIAHEMQRFLFAMILKREKRAYRCMRPASGQKNLHHTRPERKK
jgi:hypothetical protein